MSRHVGSSGGGSSRRAAPSYQNSSSSRNYSSTGASERDYSRSHLSSNGGSSANYYSSSTTRKPESGTTGYSYLEPNWIEKTRTAIPVDPYASSYLDRAPLSTSRDYSTPAAAQPVYPSAAAAALSVGGAYGAASSSMPKAYATRPEEYYRAPSALAPSAYGYSNAFEQSTMAAQAAAIYEMQNPKRESWSASHAVDYNKREDERRGGGERRREEGRREERRGANESWRDRDRDREVARDRDRRSSLSSRERDRERDARVTASSSSRRDDHREGRRTETTAAARGGAARGDRHDQSRDRPVRDSRDVSRRSVDKRAPVDDKLDRESRELERQLAKVQRELQQLESSGRGKGGSRERERERESERSRRPVPSTVTSRRAPSPLPRGRGKPTPSRRAAPGPPPRSGLSLTSSAYRTSAVRPSRLSRPLGGRGRQSAVLPSLLDELVPRPGRRSALVTTRASRAAAWEAPVRRGVAPRPPATRRIAGYATKRTTRGRGEGTISSREKVRRAKEKMRREEERRKRMDKRKEGRSKENRDKRKEEDFAWLESIMSEDEELDEETNRKQLLAPRQRRLVAIVDGKAVHPHTRDCLEAKGEADAVVCGEEPVLWTAEECEAIELLPIIDSMGSLREEVAAAFLAAHPEPLQEAPLSNGNDKMEE